MKWVCLRVSVTLVVQCQYLISDLRSTLEKALSMSTVMEVLLSPGTSDVVVLRRSGRMVVGTAPCAQHSIVAGAGSTVHATLL